MKKNVWISAAASAAALGAFCKWQNDGLTVSSIEYRNPKITEEMDGFRIVHISDYHNKNYGRGQKYLIGKIRDEGPDLIVITGDLVDSRRTDLKVAMEFIEGILPLAPVYYVAGNHEFRLRNRAWFFQLLREAGVRVLENEGVTISRETGDGEEENAGLRLIGLPDPSSFSGVQGAFQPWVLSRIKSVILQERRGDCMNILLIHRPELLELYAECGVDLVFCGHAHGGQIRLPLIGGLKAPNQGFFPRYTAGVHKRRQTSMVISRGIGNSLAPQRLWNRPEIITVTLRRGWKSGCGRSRT